MPASSSFLPLDATISNSLIIFSHTLLFRPPNSGCNGQSLLLSWRIHSSSPADCSSQAYRHAPIPPPLSINNLTSLVFISYYFKNIDFRLPVHQGRADMPPPLHSSSPQLGCGVSPIEASVLFAFDIPLTRRLWNLDFHILQPPLPIQPLTHTPPLHMCVCTSYKASVPDGLSYPCGPLTCLLRMLASSYFDISIITGEHPQCAPHITVLHIPPTLSTAPFIMELDQ